MGLGAARAGSQALGGSAAVNVCKSLLSTHRTGSTARPTGSTTPAGGFSLVELLVVIAIINATGALDQMADGVPGTPSRAYARAALIDLTVMGATAQPPWKKANGAATGDWIYMEPGAGNTGPPGMSGPVFMTRGGINSHFLGASSFHPGVIHIATCDGAVRPVRETISWVTWNLICSANDARVTAE